jgi:hypothetical protein
MVDDRRHPDCRESPGGEHVTRVGQIHEIWRFPVKSIAGESLTEAFLGVPGVLGDRLYAIHDSGAPRDFPYLTARVRKEMLLYRPLFRHAPRPSGPAATYLGAGRDLPIVDVKTPQGDVMEIGDARLLALLGDGLKPGHALTLLRSARALADCRPISLLSLQTVQSIEREAGIEVDRRRFRANLLVDLGRSAGFAEDAFVGRTLRIGETAAVTVVERDGRCAMIGIHPGTLDVTPDILRWVARNHDGNAGVYGAVVAEGPVRPGDDIVLV